MGIESTQRGIIPAAGFIDINVGGRSIPYTATLRSTAGGRLISYAGGIGDTPAPATPDTSATNWINFAFLAPVVIIRFTGAAGDSYEV